jgi:hypothetical protein
MIPSVWLCHYAKESENVKMDEQPLARAVSFRYHSFSDGRMTVLL